MKIGQTLLASYNYETDKWYVGRVMENPVTHGAYLNLLISVGTDYIEGAFKPEDLKKMGVYGLKKGDKVQVQIYESAGGNIKRIAKIKK